MKIITAEDFFNILVTFFKIIIDSRAFDDYASIEGHVTGAVHFSPNESGLKLEEAAQTFWSEVDEFTEECENVVIYGDADPTSLQAIARAFEQRCCKSTTTVCLLEGGYQAFKAKYPFMTVNGVDDEEEPRSYPSVIIPDFLYLGDLMAAMDQVAIGNLKIKYVVNATASDSHIKDDTTCIHSFCNVDDLDDAPIEKYFKKVHDFIDEAKAKSSRILVHCAAGMSRSPTLVISYLMVSLKWNLRQAYTHVKTHRSIVDINRGFMKKLIAFEKELYGTNTMSVSDFN